MSALTVARAHRPAELPTLTAAPGRGFDARALWLVDLENEVGGPTAPQERVIRTIRQLFGGIHRTEHDHVLIGTSSFFAKRVWFDLPQGVQRVLGDGPDGAENALIAATDLDWAAERFGRLVIASGDHKFVETAMEARIRGMHVHQVTGHGTPARSLLRAADTRSRLCLGQAGLGRWHADIAA